MEKISAKSRRTFVAVSFEPVGAIADEVHTLQYVLYRDDKIDQQGTIKFRPYGSKAAEFPGRESFEVAFEKDCRFFGGYSMEPPVVPVVVWNERSRKVFEDLIARDKLGYMYYSPRYFLLQKYASRKLWDSSDEHTVKEIAKKLKIRVSPCKEPDAEHIAAIMRRIEDVVEFPPVVAKAFCAICESVIEDEIIEKKEAIELGSFLQLISDRYPEFKRLENALDSAVKKDLLTNDRTPESDHLMEIITEMVNYFKKFTQDENNSEKS